MRAPTAAMALNRVAVAGLIGRGLDLGLIVLLAPRVARRIGVALTREVTVDPPA